MVDYLSVMRPDEWTEFRVLVQKGRYRRLPGAEEGRLRELALRRDPAAASMSWDELLSFAKVLLGGYVIAKVLA